MAKGWNSLRLNFTDLAELGLSISGADGRGDDNVITGQPVDGGGKTVLLGSLESVENTEDL